MHTYTYTYICIESLNSSFRKVMDLRLSQKMLQQGLACYLKTEQNIIKSTFSEVLFEKTHKYTAGENF